jgi:hypothetical protein
MAQIGVYAYYGNQKSAVSLKGGARRVFVANVVGRLDLGGQTRAERELRWTRNHPHGPTRKQEQHSLRSRLQPEGSQTRRVPFAQFTVVCQGHLR